MFTSTRRTWANYGNGVAFLDEGDLSEGDPRVREYSEKVQAIFVREARLKAQEVPLLPAAARQALAAAGRTDVQFADLATIIQSDPALATAVLARANSPFFGGRKTTALRTALSRIGLRGLRDLLLSAGAARILRVKVDPEFGERLVERSQAVAVAAAALAEATGRDRDDAYTAGLIHDIGWSIVLGLFTSCRRALPAEVQSDPELQFGLARDMHEAIGAEMAVAWELPEPVCGAVGWHHEPRSALVGGAMAWTIAGARELIDELGIHRESSLAEGHLRALGLDAGTLGSIRAHVARRLGVGAGPRRG